ncbi:hypothetical protein HanIR_Chr13g0650871 [Helianthus annuus]|nr:hypothetical protein HanIR_Chr13g0650871 [Helianthus annuus]
MQGVKKHEQHKRTYSTATNMLFHFIRGDRQQFTMEDLLSVEAEVMSGMRSLGTSYKALVIFVKRFRSVIIEEKKARVSCPYDGFGEFITPQFVTLHGLLLQ